MSDSGELTRLLAAARNGDDAARDSLFDRVYQDLRTHAARRLRGSPRHITLQTTALISEAYIKLFGDVNGGADWANRRHFYFAASRAMRDTVVEYARRKDAKKRGGDRRRVVLDDLNEDATFAIDVLQVDEALTRLQQHDAQCAEVVRLRFYGGLNYETIADVLQLSVAKVRREWAYARSWLARDRDLRDTVQDDLDDAER